MIDSNVRVDFEIVQPNQSDLSKVQAKINQWITKGELLSYKHTIVNGVMVFEFCRKKQQEG